MPGDVIVGGRKDESDKTRRTQIDVAARANETGSDGADAADDAFGPQRWQAIHIEAGNTVVLAGGVSIQELAARSVRRQTGQVPGFG